MTQLGPCSPRLVSQYLELTGIDKFVAASYSAQRKVTVAMEERIVEFGKEEEKGLAAGMTAKEITVCQDETFKNAVYLVAIDPVSNMILLEVAAPNRTADTWTKTMAESIGNLPVKIIQSTSDEAAGILDHVKNDLGAHHSPDLFHVQQDMVKGMYPSLAARTRQAANSLQKAKTEVNRLEKEQALKNSHILNEASIPKKNNDSDHLVDSNKYSHELAENPHCFKELDEVGTNLSILPQKELSESVASEATFSFLELDELDAKPEIELRPKLENSALNSKKELNNTVEAEKELNQVSESEKKELPEASPKEPEKQLERIVQKSSDDLSELQDAYEREKQAQANLLEAQNRQNSAKEVVEGINLAYHPYNLETGEEKSSEVVSEDLANHFNKAL